VAELVSALVDDVPEVGGSTSVLAEEIELDPDVPLEDVVTRASPVNR